MMSVPEVQSGAVLGPYTMNDLSLPDSPCRESISSVNPDQPPQSRIGMINDVMQAIALQRDINWYRVGIARHDDDTSTFNSPRFKETLGNPVYIPVQFREGNRSILTA